MKSKKIIILTILLTNVVYSQKSKIFFPKYIKNYWCDKIKNDIPNIFSHLNL